MFPLKRMRRIAVKAELTGFLSPPSSLPLSSPVHARPWQSSTAWRPAMPVPCSRPSQPATPPSTTLATALLRLCLHASRTSSSVGTPPAMTGRAELATTPRPLRACSAPTHLLSIEASRAQSRSSAPLPPPRAAPRGAPSSASPRFPIDHLSSVPIDPTASFLSP